LRSGQPKSVKVAQTAFSYKNERAGQKDLPKLSNFAARSGSGFSGLKDYQDYDDVRLVDSSIPKILILINYRIRKRTPAAILVILLSRES
jgi:hypothetical protein